jgi:hypothetical protein
MCSSLLGGVCAQWQPGHVHIQEQNKIGLIDVCAELVAEVMRVFAGEIHRLRYRFQDS